MLFQQLDAGWLIFFLLFLVPDLSMFGYIAGPRIGALTYNIAHTYAAPAVVGGIAHLSDNSALVGAALIWSAHIGFDRMLGYGLKLPSGFHDTHLGPLRRPSSSSG